MAEPFVYEGGQVAWELRHGITRVHIDPQVTDIAPSAFFGCKNLVEVLFNDGLRLLATTHLKAARRCET